ncbi:glutathione S-transferase family protein [Rhizobacter sp. LjRoot28]|uniref:glutathione S-transferase family protein n=1 Tax=Rhizobacter sp. LjRoot28 TaxID=3342309 RepID=UPI003ECFC6B0
MKLVGMLDSPYVRRVAVSLQLMRLPFEHASVSVFSTFEQFRAINPVVKAPSLVCDDGEVLMDSTLILQYLQAMPCHRNLMPEGLAEQQHALRMIGLGLAACEKSVQMVYEHQLRPSEKRHDPWLTRVTGQLLAACAALETDLRQRPLACEADTIDQAGVTAAVTWTFIQAMLPEVVPAAAHPAWAAFTTRAESMVAFSSAPHGPGLCQPLA